MAIDLNADVGEGFGDDERLLEVVTSANVACGFHAGSAETMRTVCAAGASRGVAVGAHPSYRDREGFGRRELDVPLATLREDVAEQVAALIDVAAEEGARSRTSSRTARSTHARSQTPRWLARSSTRRRTAWRCSRGPGRSSSSRRTRAGMAAFGEGFADRRYANGRLVPRGRPGALLAAPEAAAQAVALAQAGEVHSICVHGDSPGAAELAVQVRAALATAGFTIRRFAWA